MLNHLLKSISYFKQNDLSNTESNNMKLLTKSKLSWISVRIALLTKGSDSDLTSSTVDPSRICVKAPRT